MTETDDPKVALITGGARGIGRALALALGERGWRVAICYRSSEPQASETAARLQQKGAAALAVRSDVSDPAQAESLVRRVETEWGRLDALINCAGPYHRVDLLEETVSGWREMFDHNLHPVFYLGRLVAPIMKRRRWGRIVNFSMANADQLVAQSQWTAYYIAKAGVLVLTRSLARVLAADGITVNAISPGLIDSGSTPRDELAKMVKNIPAGYLGETRDAVAAALFLLSEEARYITGANIQVSGGWGI